MATYGSSTYGTAIYGVGADAVGGDYDSRGVISFTASSDLRLIGEVIELAWTVHDAAGEPANPTTTTLTVTIDGGSPETIPTTYPETGSGLAGYRPTVAGAYTARLTLDGDHAGATVERFIVIPADPWRVTVSQLRAYLVDTSATDEEIADALNAERYAQAARCRIDKYTPDLLQALKRRVARNLAARRVPVASLTSFDGGTTSTRVPRTDPEVSRLEAPYRRRPVG